jgi:hypothetical protein
VVVKAGGDFGAWNLKLTPPQRAVYERGDRTMEDMDQSYSGNVYLGRVNERTYMVASEANASAPLFNISPFGEWQLTVEGPSTSGLTAEVLEQIDLHLTVSAC